MRKRAEGEMYSAYLIISQDSDCSDIHPRVNDELFKLGKLGGIVVSDELR